MEEKWQIILDKILSELSFQTSRSGGSGGQHVNKVETKVTLKWNVFDSGQLSEDEKNRIIDKLSNQITSSGFIVIHDGSSRSQLKNKENTILKLSSLLQKTFQKEKKRIKTKVPKEAKEKRKQQKQAKSQLKQSRKKPDIKDY